MKCSISAKMRTAMAVFCIVSGLSPLQLRRIISERRDESAAMNLSSEEVIDGMASAVELNIPRDVRTGVSLAFDGLAKAAAEVRAFPLPAYVEIALVFIP
jgi:Protein of unknown function (DUF4089)